MQQNSQNHPQNEELEGVEIVDLESSSSRKPVVQQGLGPRLTLPQRRRQILMTVFVVCVGLLLLLASQPSVQSLLLRNTLSAATPLAGGSDQFYVQKLPAWGAFYLDGQPLPRFPLVTSEQPLRLPQGTHRLEWRGEPFEPLSCIVTVPAVNSSDKRACNVQVLEWPNNFVRSAVFLSFPGRLSLNSMPQTERQALVNATQTLLNSLDSSSQLEPEESRLTEEASGGMRQVEVSTRVQQQFVLETDTKTAAACQGLQLGEFCSVGEQDCREFCTIDWPTRKNSSSRNAWHVAVIYRTLWTYATENGNVERVRGGQYFLTFEIHRQQGRWSVAFHNQRESSFNDPNCIPMIGQLVTNATYLEIERMNVAWKFISGQNRADGCLAIATLGSTPATVNLLYRGGVLQTLDSYTAGLWPQLARATDKGRQIAREIETEPAFVS